MRVSDEPIFLTSGCLSGSVVVHNQVHCQGGVDLGFKVVEKTKELPMAMPRVALTNRAPVQQIECWERGRGPEPAAKNGFVVPAVGAARDGGRGGQRRFARLLPVAETNGDPAEPMETLVSRRTINRCFFFRVSPR
jgi:hypothetical protein